MFNVYFLIKYNKIESVFKHTLTMRQPKKVDKQIKSRNIPQTIRKTKLALFTSTKQNKKKKIKKIPQTLQKYKTIYRATVSQQIAVNSRLISQFDMERIID